MKVLDRQQLLEEMRASHRKLDETLDSIEESSLWDEPAVDDLTVRDLLAVRTRWTEMLSAWIEAGLRGEIPETPAPGFKWNETPRLNASIVAEEGFSTPPELRSRLNASLEDLRSQINRLTDAQLMLTEQFGWTRSWAVSRWISMNTVTQYRSLLNYARRTLREHEARGKA